MTSAGRARRHAQRRAHLRHRGDDDRAVEDLHEEARGHQERHAAQPLVDHRTAQQSTRGDTAAMTFIETVPESDASGELAQMYETDREVFGHVPNLTRAFSHRPDVYAAWRQLNGAIKAQHGPAPLRAGHRRRRAPAALELLHAGARVGAHGQVRRARRAGGDRLRPPRRRPRPRRRGRDGPRRQGRRGRDLGDPGRRRRACARTGSPTPRSSTWSRPPRRAASSARCSTASARSPTPSTQSSTRRCARRSRWGARSPTRDEARRASARIAHSHEGVASGRAPRGPRDGRPPPTT